MKLYFAPINKFSNYIYRHLMLKYRADYVFSEMIIIKDIDKEITNHKIKYFDSDLKKTIFQIGVSNNQEIDKALNLISFAKELNINMDCPHSSMKNLCGGLLHNEELMDELTAYFAKVCRKQKIIPSVKIRLGTSEKNIRINSYIKIFEKNKIKKLYIHARPLRYPYERKAIYEPLYNLKKTKLKIIINGDIDNYYISKELYKKTGFDQMIGRAALINPFLFEEIKNKKNSKKGSFDPVKKDPNIIVSPNKSIMSKKKIDFISEYEKLCRDNNEKPNLKYLYKGITKK